MDASRKMSEERSWRGVLMKDGKPICDIQSYNIPIELPSRLIIHTMDAEALFPLSTLPSFKFHPLAPNPARLVEWQRFLTFLMSNNKVAIVRFPGWELLINPPLQGLIHPKQAVIVSYRQKGSVIQKLDAPPQPPPPPPPLQNPSFSNQTWLAETAHKGLEQSQIQGKMSMPKPTPAIGLPIMAQTHPSYLETLGQNHASWIFGALAELVDNARDAQATRLDISIEEEYYKAAGTRIPVLSVTDNGSGMSHSSILRMLSFGHKKPENDNEDLIGRFGVGFKTGSMRLGKDVVVFTQCKQTRSIAFLSRSYCEEKENVEIPIITYQKDGGYMEFDLQVHSHEQAQARLKVVKDYSPFNEYSIGHKFSMFGQGTGTIICIYNLDRWGSDYTLQWDPKTTTDIGATFACDITIRSQRVRSRPSQITKEVPLDYSLHAYLEVIFLEPKMKIYVQGTLVKTRRLHMSLNKTTIFRHTLLGKNVELIVGWSQEEKDRGNCGIFFYWHGRLIEAYRRVGEMIYTPDLGLGVIGIIDVTDIMRLENGSVAVLNNKQGFQDCEAWDGLVGWVGKMTTIYWDNHFDSLKLDKKVENAVYTPDCSWVQCNTCLKWRVLPINVSAADLPDEWFCYMPPFRGSCSMPEYKVDATIRTISATRTYANLGAGKAQVKEDVELSTSAGNSAVSNDKESSNMSTGSEGDIRAADSIPSRKANKLKRGLPGQASNARQPALQKFRKSG